MLGWPLLEDKESFGCSPFDTVISLPTSPVDVAMLKDSLKSEKEDICTGKFSPPLTRRSLLPELLACSENITPSSQEVPPLEAMYGRMKRQFLPPGLNLGNALLTQEAKLTGTWYGNAPSPETLNPYPRSYGLKVIVPSVLSEAISRRLTQWFVHASCFGVLQERVNRREPGRKQETVLTLNLHDPNSGMVTSMKNMLSSMNLEEISTLGTFSPGWTDIPYEWRLKGHQYR